MVYVIVVYDFEAERTRKPKKLLRRYLNHVQNSVFEGQITVGELDDIKTQLDSMTKSHESAMVYKTGTEEYLERYIFGEDPTDELQFI